MASDIQAVRRRFPANHRLIRQGQRGEHAWLIESGTLEVVLENAGAIKRLGQVGRGALVGEMALIDDGVRSASVRALSEVEAIELSRDTFHKMIAASQPLARYLLESLVAAIRRVYGLDVEERGDGGEAVRSTRTTTRILNRRAFPLGHVFFRQGEAGDVAFLVQAGRVAIRRADGEELGVLGPGRLFGELALIGDRPRLAEAVCVEPATCEIIRRDEFDKALATMPTILKSLTRIYVEQLASARRG